jgi:hypothetical protein
MSKMEMVMGVPPSGSDCRSDDVKGVMDINST